MTVKQAVENARLELDRKWREKYPFQEMRIYLAIEYGWRQCDDGVRRFEPLGQSWKAEIHSKRPTSRSRQWRAYDSNGKIDNPGWYLRHNIKKLRKFRNPEKFFEACNTAGIAITRQQIYRIRDKE
jgi:hypothetical protein